MCGFNCCQIVSSTDALNSFYGLKICLVPVAFSVSVIKNIPKISRIDGRITPVLVPFSLRVGRVKSTFFRILLELVMAREKARKNSDEKKSPI